MLKVRNGIVEAEGTGVDLMKDFALVVQTFVDKGVMSKDLMLEIVETFGMSDKEIIKKKLIEEIDEMDNIGDALNLLGQVLSDRRLQ